MHFHNITINLDHGFKSGYMFKCKTSNDPKGTKVLFSSCSLVKKPFKTQIFVAFRRKNKNFYGTISSYKATCYHKFTLLGP